MRNRDEHSPDNRGRVGTPTRTVVLMTVAAVVFIAAVVFLYDRGLIPVAGIFVAMALGPLIVLWRRAALARRRAGITTEVLECLEDLARRLSVERSLAASERPSGASDRSLLDATELVDKAVQRFAWADEAGAHALASRAVDLTRSQQWADSPLARAVAELEEPLADLAAVLAKLDAAAARAGRTEKR